MSNLLQKASIITTPTAYDTGKILSVKPVEYYGPELVTNGDFATDSDWNKETGWTISGGNLIATNVSGTAAYQTGNGLVNNKLYKVQFEITEYTNGSVGLRAGTGATLQTFSSIGVHFVYMVVSGALQVRFDVIGTTTLKVDNVSVKEALNADFDFTRNSSATRVGSNGLIQDVASNLPRIDYTGGVGSWKFEPQSTNQLLSSNNLTSNWSLVDVTAEYGFLSPDGTNNASKLTATGTDPYAFAYSQNITSQDYTGSAYIKGIGSSIGQTGKIWIIIDNVYFLQRVFTITGDWQRVSITEQLGVTVSNFLYMRLDLPDSNPVIGEQVLVWGAQLENLLYPTSIIPTSGSATTRLADAANNAGSSNLINSTEGVLYAEISALADDSTNRQMTLSDGTNTNRLVLKYDNQSNIIQSFNRVGGVESAFLSATILDITLFSKCLVKYKENDYQLWINGYKLDTDTNSTVWPSSTLNDFKINEGGGADFFGNVKSVAVFKEALTDLELECLVSWMSFSDLGINFGYTVE